MAITIQLRRDTEANFNTANTVPAEGEMLLATDTHKAVIGDGSGQDFETMVTNNKFFNFEDGDGGRVFGGNDANETITVRGGSSQTNPIFKVTTNNTSNSIVEIYDDTQLVKIDATHGATGDKTLLLKAKASQTGSVIEVQDSSSTDARFKVLEDGQTTITPNDTTSPSLDVKGSGGSQSNGILRVQDNSGNTEFTVSDGGATVAGTLGVTGETTATGGIKVDDITEATADHGIDFAKPISVTGNIIGNSNLVIPNQPCQTRFTQTSAVATYTDAESATASDMSYQQVTQLAVDITPAVAGSKMLVEVSANFADTDASNDPETLVCTFFRRVGSGSHVDLSGQDSNSSSDTIKALMITSTTRDTSHSSDTPQNIHVEGSHLDTPTYSLGDTLRYTLGVGTCGKSSNRDVAVQLNKSNAANSTYHQIEMTSLIKVTEIPQ